MRMRHRFDPPFRGLHVLALLGPVMIIGCVAEPPPAVTVRPELPPPDSTVYFYPAQSHPAPSPEQQDRDKYECNAWAVQQSGFDPSLPSMPPHQRVRVVAGGPPPGTGVGLGAVTGALIGAAVSDPWHTGSGALVGALAGAAIGGAAEAGSAAEAERLWHSTAAPLPS
jgi:hypothetical protein